MSRARPARLRRALVGMTCALVSASACDDPARPLAAPEGGSLSVVSDPAGADIYIDGERVGGPTPAVVPVVPEGVHELRIALDSIGDVYDYRTFYQSTADSQAVFDVPLTLRCGTAACAAEAFFSNQPGEIRFALSAAGPPFTLDGQSHGVVWPEGSGNSYVAAAAPVIAARAGEREFALGVYNYATPFNYWAGRPVPDVSPIGDYTVEQTSWLLPYETANPALRGIAVEQHVNVPAAFPDVVLITLTFRNISDQPAYRALDAGSPAEGVAYSDVYAGLALDPNIGGGDEAWDELVAYDPARSLAFAYDGDLSVDSFGAASDRPGLIGVALLGPTDADVRMNAWTPVEDWRAGRAGGDGYGFLTATQTQLPDHPLPSIGYAPDRATSDYLFSVTAGPFDLAPAESLTVSLVLIMASPAAGAFTSGELLPAGDPANPDRPASALASVLTTRLDQLRALNE